MPFNGLPLELLQLIFGYCSGKDLKSVALVCHLWADAVRFKKTCLIVSKRLKPQNRGSRTLFIGRRVLQNARRQYTRLNIEWRSTETDRNMQLQEDLLDICQKRFSAGVKGLFLRAPPSGTLAGFFEKRREWLQDLVELEVDLEPAASDSTGREVVEVSFPHLRKLTWREYGADGDPSKRWQIGKVETCHAFTLIVPRLRDLAVIMNCCLSRRNMESRLQDQDTCRLFLPTLVLKRYENLDTVTINGLHGLDQRYLDNSEAFLRNLRVLRFFKTDWREIERICEKCTNLKELIVEEVPEGNVIDLQVSPTLSSCLERLAINFRSQAVAPLRLVGRAVFQNLRSICLRGLVLEERVTLVAPQLTECDTISTIHDKLTLARVEQMRTLNAVLSNETMATVVSQPNVEEMCLQLIRTKRSYRFVPNYVEHFPNIWRLAVLGCSSMLDWSFVERLRRLEYFSAWEIKIRLKDVKKLAGLKKLKLIECILKVKPTDGEVSLEALEEVTLDCVAVEGPISREDRFPIRVNGKQLPIVFEKVSPKGMNVFRSKSV